MNRKIKIFSVLFVFALFILGLASCDKNTDDETITLKLTSWRTEDVEQMNRINDLFTETHPNIKINFEPSNTVVYDEVTNTALQNGVGADIIFLRSYDKGRALYNNGYLYNLTNIIPNLTSYSPVVVKAWSDEEGVTYGVPSVGVAHGIYYQKSIFKGYNIKEPATWDELIAVCETLLKGGETVIAHGASDTWTLYETVFSGLGPNFYGGEASRQSLMAGTMTLTDPKFIEAFKAVNSLKKYLPSGFETLDYEHMRQMFGSGNAAMFIGGSWELSIFNELGSDTTKIGWFAPPVVKAGDKLQYCFHVDAGIGINKNSKNLDAAIEYIKWVSGSEYAQAIMNELPGFFSYTPGTTVSPSNALAKKMYVTSATADLTVRTMCEKLSSGSPGGNTLMNEALNCQKCRT